MERIFVNIYLFFCFLYPPNRFSGPEKIPIICSTQDGSVCVGGSGTGKIFVWLVCVYNLFMVVNIANMFPAAASCTPFSLTKTNMISWVNCNFNICIGNSIILQHRHQPEHWQECLTPISKL